MDAILQFTVTNQEMERTDEFIVVEGSENYLQAQFTCTTPDWDGMTKTGVFIDADGDAHPSLCAGDICEVPKEWLIKQKGFVGLIGSDGTTKITTKAVRVSIKEKGYTSGGEIEEETQTYFDQLIAAFAEKYAEAEAQAKLSRRWAVGLDEEPETLEDNAKYYAGQARNDATQTQSDRNAVSELSEHIDTVAMQVDADKTEAGQYKEQAAASAANALQSEQAAKTSETAAQEAMAGAEAAEGQAELFANQAAEDKSTVEAAKTLIMQMGQEVADNKEAVERTVSGFELLHQQAVKDINNAGQAQTERVEGAGDQAVNDITDAQTQGVKAVNDTGAQQVSAITAEGKSQVANVQEAAAEIIADRGQIAENKSGISELKGDLSNKLPKSPADWEAWTVKEQAAARGMMGMVTDTPFELVGDVTTEEVVNSIILTLRKPCRYVSITFIIPTETVGKSRNVYFSASEKVNPTTCFHRSLNAQTSESNYAIYKSTAEIVGGEVISYGGISTATSISIDYAQRPVYGVIGGYGGLKADNFTNICVFTYSEAFPIGSSVKIYGC